MERWAGMIDSKIITCSTLPSKVIPRFLTPTSNGKHARTLIDFPKTYAPEDPRSVRFYNTFTNPATRVPKSEAETDGHQSTLM